MTCLEMEKRAGSKSRFNKNVGVQLKYARRKERLAFVGGGGKSQETLEYHSCGQCTGICSAAASQLASQMDVQT